MKYNYCVCGAGRQGVAAIYDLLRFCNAESVLVCEPSLDATNKAGHKLKELLGDQYHHISWVSSINQPTDPSIDWNEIDVIISCAPWAANFDLAKFAVDHHIPFCDLGGNPDTVAKQEQIITKTAIVPDCGLSPGISNILAVQLAKSGCDEIRVRCGGIPAIPWRDKPNYRLTFDPMGLISEYSGNAPVIVDGRIQYVKTLSTIYKYNDLYECSYTSNNSPQVVEYLQSLGVLNYDYMTIRHPGHWQLVRHLKDVGFFCGDVDLDSALAQILSQNNNLLHNPNSDIDQVILSVTGKYGHKCLRRTCGFDINILTDLDTRFSAMELMTSWGITMVAKYMVEHPEKTPNGFATPERFVPADYILAELEKRKPRGV